MRSGDFGGRGAHHMMYGRHPASELNHGLCSVDACAAYKQPGYRLYKFTISVGLCQERDFDVINEKRI